MGAPDTSEGPEIRYRRMEDADAEGGDQLIASDESGGVFSYTDGHKIDIIGGSRNVIIGGEQRITIGGGGEGVWDAGKCYYSKMRPVSESLWRTTVKDYSASDTYKIGDAEDFFLGFTFSGKLSLDASIFVGGNLSLSAAVTASAEAALKTSFSAAVSWSESKEESVTTAPKPSMTGSETVTLSVKSVENASAGMTAGIAAAAGLVVGVGVGAGAGSAQNENTSDAAEFGAGVGATAGLLAAASAATLTKLAYHKELSSRTEIKLDKDTISISANNIGGTANSYIKLTKVGILFEVGESSMLIDEKSISLSAKNLDLSCDKITTQVDADEIKLKAKKFISMKSAKSMIRLDENVKLKGEKILHKGPLKAVGNNLAVSE
jgi:hypothetical protein